MASFSSNVRFLKAHPWTTLARPCSSVFASPTTLYLPVPRSLGLCVYAVSFHVLHQLADLCKCGRQKHIVFEAVLLTTVVRSGELFNQLVSVLRECKVNRVR